MFLPLFPFEEPFLAFTDSQKDVTCYNDEQTNRFGEGNIFEFLAVFYIVSAHFEEMVNIMLFVDCTLYKFRSIKPTFVFLNKFV